MKRLHAAKMAAIMPGGPDALRLPLLPRGAMAAWLGVALGAPAAPSAAATWEVEVGGGILGGLRLSVPPPFELDGVRYGGPYSQCTLPADICLFLGGGDVAYFRSENYRWGFLGSVDVRRRTGRFTLGAGVMAALSQRRQRVARTVLGEADPSRPLEPEELRGLTFEWRTRGFHPLAYLHANVRREVVFGSEDMLYGGRTTRFGLFLEVGGGVLASFPGHLDARDGRPAGAAHGVLGGRIHRRGRDIVFAAGRVHAFAGAGHLMEGRFAWTVFRLGVVFDD